MDTQEPVKNVKLKKVYHLKRRKKSEESLNRAIGFKRFLLAFLSFCFLLFATGMFLLYGPFNFIRETLITTAMTTMTHQYLATWFYGQDTIDEVMSRQYVLEPEEDTDPDQIEFKEPEEVVYANEYERAVLEHEEGAIYKIIDIKGDHYKGYLVAVYDPSKVKIATTKYLGTRGQSTKVMARDNNALVAMNASGFYDPDWNSNGSTPHGTVIKDGKVVWDFKDAGVGGGFIGFTYENKLVLGRMTKEQALNIGMRDAIEFGPFLIVNGKPAFVKGNGGWGISPRSAIAQRQDGIVLMLVIDGRRTDSIGADLVDVTEVLMNYGAYNAANLDGGSSTSLIVGGQVYSHPVAGGEEGLRNLPTAWIVTE